MCLQSEKLWVNYFEWKSFEAVFAVNLFESVQIFAQCDVIKPTIVITHLLWIHLHQALFTLHWQECSFCFVLLHTSKGFHLNFHIITATSVCFGRTFLHYSKAWTRIFLAVFDSTQFFSLTLIG